jgi:hypothetical protein
MDLVGAIFSVLCLGNPAGDGGEVVALHVPRLATPLGQVLAVAATVAVAFFIWRCYRREAGYLRPRRRRLLAGLRMGGALVLLWMASGAFLELARDDGSRPSLLVLVDRSASMALADRRSEPADRAAAAALLGREPAQDPTRDELLRAAVAGAASDPLRLLAPRHRLEGYTFGQGAGLAPFTLGEAAQGQALAALPAPAEEATRLGDALRDAGRRAAGRRVAGVLLFTDGGGNLGEDPQEAVRDLGLPVFAAGTGLPRSRDLEVAFVFCEDVVFKNDRFPVEVRLRQRGYPGLSVPLQITRTGPDGRSEVVREEQVAFGAEGELTRSIEVVPDREGVFTYAAELPVQGDEPNRVNNRRARANVRVVDGKMRVLVADRSPRWEYRFIKGVLDADRQRIAPSYLLQQGDPGERMVRRLPAKENEWRAIDAVILGDVDAAAIAPDELAALERWVKVQGGGLLVVAGRQGVPGSFAGGVLAVMLPVECDAQAPLRPDDERSRPLRQAVQVLPTAEGERHPLLRLSADPAASHKAWAEATGLTWFHPVRRLKRGATALLVHPTLKAGDEPLPVLSSQRYGRGQVMFLASDETWRWRLRPGAAEHRRFWGQMVSNLAMAHLLGNASRMQVETERGEYAVGEKVGIIARVMDQALNPLAAASVAVTIERDLARTRVVLPARPGHPGVFTGEWPAADPGTWRITIEGATGEDAVERRINVVSPNRELDDAGCRADLLERLAASTGGAYRPIERARELAELVAARARAGDRLHEERPVWNAPGLLLLLALLLGLEWFLRKRSDLL